MGSNQDVTTHRAGDRVLWRRGIKGKSVYKTVEATVVKCMEHTCTIEVQEDGKPVQRNVRYDSLRRST